MKEPNESNPLDKEYIQFEQLISGVLTAQFAAIEYFLTAKECAGLRKHLNILFKKNTLHKAGFGNKSSFQNNISVRGDQIKWINNASINHFEVIFIAKMERLMWYLNQTCFTALKSFEAHYAMYEPNLGYIKHYDQFKTDDRRQFSLILYLNENWKITDGGCLRLFPDNAAQIDILPIEGKVVFFKSNQLLHQVIPANSRNRMSIAVWFKN
jgi:SM-20-related protein